MADDQCSVRSCEQAIIAKGWCRKHYNRMLKHGSTDLPPRKLPPQNLPRTFGCGIEDCGEKHYGKGFCHRHYSQAWSSSNREHSRAVQAAYRAKPENRQKAIDRSRDWREDNPGRANEASREWYAKNRDAVREYKRKYREDNRDLIRALNNKRKAAIRNVQINDLTGQQWREIKAIWRNRCAYCGDAPPMLTMDHYDPIATGGNHTASNIVPACLSCNCKKNAGNPPPFWFERLGN